MNLLYITRKFPPMIGGMEKLSYALTKEFAKQKNSTFITWGKSQKYLPFILLLFFIKALYLIPTKKIDHIHLGDALLSPLGLLLKKFFGIKTTTTVCGLDITFNFPGYQLIVPWCVSKLDKVICISNATLEECVKRGISREKCVMIPCGVYPEEFKIKATRKDLEKIVGQKLDGKKVIITVGRLVERKGVYWFIKNVFPKLDKNFVYLVIGEGSERDRIEKLINELGYENRIFLLGKISDKDLKIIYNTANLFVMPNIKVKNDVEGFGIVAVEAASTGLPIVASSLEGVQDAIINNRTGRLVETKNTKEFIEKMQSNSLQRLKISNNVKIHFSWDKLGERYLKAFHE